MNIENLFDISNDVAADTQPYNGYDFSIVDVTRPEDYRSLYDRTKNTLCGIGQNRTKRLLAKKQQEGDEIAGLYRAVLNAESSYAYYCMYLGNRRYDERYYSNYCTCIELLMQTCVVYNQQHTDTPVTIGYKPWAGVGGACLFFYEIPEMRPVSFYSYNENVEQYCLLPYENDWDGIVNGNYGKMEEAVMTRYATDILQKRKQTDCHRKKMSCVSPRNLLTPYDNVCQALQLINMQDTSGRNVTMSDVYITYKSYSLDTSTYVLPHGMYVIHIQDKTWSGKLYESLMQYLHCKLRARDWYIWTSMSTVENRIDVIAYVAPLFDTEVEAKANIAVIYSKIMLAIVDYLNTSCDNILTRHIISVDGANSIWEASYSAIMQNGAFDPVPLFPNRQFLSDEDYYNYVYDRCGMVNPYYKHYFCPPDPPKIITHDDDDDFDVGQYIAEATAHYGRR